MPSRLMIAAILAFWLGMTGLLIHFEVLPMMLADASPSYQPDLTDEIGAPLIAWQLKKNGKRAGSATSRIVARGDRSFELHTIMHFDIPLMQVNQIETIYRVNESRKLMALYAKFVVGVTAIEIRGEVVGHTLEPRLFIDDVEQKMLDPGKIDVNQQGDVINAMSLVNRLRGLHDGQTWIVPLLDLSRGSNLPYMKAMSGPGSLIAMVKNDTLEWNGKKVGCYKIEYHESGKEVTARTWVRRIDGTVLQQESAHLGTELVLERMP